jgi:hypothetical protein
MRSDKKQTKKSRREGQTLIEFALVSIIFIFMLVVTLNGILAFSIQQYLSYAVFMSARAYQAAAKDPEEQRKNALMTLESLVPNFRENGNFDVQFPSFGTRSLATVTQVEIPDPQVGDYGPAGVGAKAIRMVFDVPLAPLPLGDTIRANFGKIQLEAESFLGREVTQSECRSFFKSFIGKFRISGASDVQSKNDVFVNEYSHYMEDNGC